MSVVSSSKTGLGPLPTMASSLQGVGLVDLLECDPRPSFVIALAATQKIPIAKEPSILYANPALQSSAALAAAIRAPLGPHAKLWQWAHGQELGGVGLSRHALAPSYLLYLDTYWVRTVVQQKWVVVSANQQPPPTRPGRVTRFYSQESIFESSPSQTTRAAEDTKRSDASASPVFALPHLGKTSTDQPQPATSGKTSHVPSRRRSSADPGWELPDIMPDQEPFLDVVNSVDWDKTPLGPMKAWPTRLRQTVSQILADSRPIAMYWGPAYTTVYNKAFSKLLGSKHPRLLGRPVDEVWPEVGGNLKETMRTSAQKKRATTEDEWRFFVEKAPGRLDETYLKWSIVPIVEGEQTLGFTHPVLETTSMRLWERRMKMLIDLGDVLITARDVKSYWSKTMEELASVEPRYDVPLAILYSVHHQASDRPSSPTQKGQHKYGFTQVCQLEGVLGVPHNHPIAPGTLELAHSESGLSAMFRETLSGQEPVLIQTRDDTLPARLLGNLDWRGFGDPCSAAVVIPVRPTKEEGVMGLLLLGLNPRRHYDNEYRQYISLLSQKLNTSLAATVLLEEESRRGRNAMEQAAYDQAVLRERLAVQTQEATESLGRFQAVAGFVPVGMFFGDYSGNITFANDAFFRITGLQGTIGTTVPAESFMECVVEEDRLMLIKAYEDVRTLPSISFEFRIKRRSSGRGAETTARKSAAAGEYESAIGPPTTSTTKPAHTTSSTSTTSKKEAPGPHSGTTESLVYVLASAKAERAPDGSIIRVLTCLTDVTQHKETAEEAIQRAQQAENLKRMAEFATVGMYDMDLEGRLLGANNVFYEICGLERTDPAEAVVKPWEICVREEDRSLLQERIAKLVTGRKVQTAELRLEAPWLTTDDAGNRIVATRWVLASFMPIVSSDGVVRSFTGCVSHVSYQKWQLEKETKRKEEAIESKREQENFIDMTSHEMRNPLSAIVHCADAVIASLAKVQEINQSQISTPTVEEEDTLSMASSPATPDHLATRDSLIRDSIDNAEIIISCTQHQRRIVDDILTMSKLDSKLLAVTPITASPVQTAQEALKMFEVEARRVDIDLSMSVDASYHALGVQFLDYDPSRLKQVLINLLTNALKFTKTGSTRRVSVTLSASDTQPTDDSSEVQYIPRSDESLGDEYTRMLGHGTPKYLLFSVKDTGQGLSPEEKSSLFKRFVQATSRTHVDYGGSGLGLFISRRLTEMQNGAIGVASKPGVGSTFAFYIEAYPPEEESLRQAQIIAAQRIANLNPIAARAVQAQVGANSLVRPQVLQNVQDSAVELEQEDQPPAVTGILVVEDNLINQQITRRGLMDRGYMVEVANHGLEALEKLQKSNRSQPATTTQSAGSTTSLTSQGGGSGFPVSLILMDIEMPIQDGLTCTRNIRALEEAGRLGGGRIPIIAVSANARAEQIEATRAAGCDDVLVKPYRMTELVEKMAAVNKRVWEETQEGGLRKE